MRVAHQTIPHDGICANCNTPVDMTEVWWCWTCDVQCCDHCKVIGYDHIGHPAVVCPDCNTDTEGEAT